MVSSADFFSAPGVLNSIAGFKRNQTLPDHARNQRFGAARDLGLGRALHEFDDLFSAAILRSFLEKLPRNSGWGG